MSERPAEAAAEKRLQVQERLAEPMEPAERARLNACVRGGLAELDCSLFGTDFSCQTSGSAFFCGMASECDPSTHEKSCDGTSAVFCNAGKIARVDCAALGFTSCIDDPMFGCE